MARKSTSGRAANGAGTIRKKAVIRNGKEYTFWEGRYTAGYDPGTGKQIQRSVTGKTQKEVSQKLKAITHELDLGTYIAPSKMSVAEWLTIWSDIYLCNVKPRTVEIYKTSIRHHISPALGAIKLEELSAPAIQNFYNNCTKQKKLSPKSIKNIHGVLHKALQQAVASGYLRFNPACSCTLPRVQKSEIIPFDDNDISAFLREIKGSRHEVLLTITLFTGLREGEVMGLTWDCVDFDHGIITVNKQLQHNRSTGEYSLAPTKNSKGRTITPASFVMTLLKQHHAAQAKERLFAGSAWVESNFVFTDPLGNHLKHWTPYRAFKRAAAAIGRPDARFHDLRHSYAVAAIRSGDDIKTVQGNLGHATASFTLDVYGHVTDQMKQASAARMDAYIKQVKDG